MGSPLAALTWEVWRRGRRSACLALGCIAVCAVINLAAPERFYARVGQNLYGLLMVVSFLLTFGIFNCTEISSTKDWNGFPYRLFVLPVPTWQLVTLPMLLGIVWVETVYLAWMKLVWTHASVPAPGWPVLVWPAVVLGAYMVFYQAVLWGLAAFRITRLLTLGLGGTSSIAVVSLPMFGKIVPSPWFSEERLVPIVAGLAVLAFVAAWAAVERQRHSGGRRRSWLKTQYERIADAEWEMHRLEVEELESYVTRLLEVGHSIYDVVEFESKVEYEFAKALDARKDIKLFFKLPDWFKVETPLGTYNPDWAIVREEPDGQNKLYLVRETKGTTDWLKIPEIQRKKIQCGKAHFKAVGLKDGGYDWVASANEV